ncbi:MAG: hypothetical protein IIW14_05645, partial [Kiritimatiellae bacterium]|nr:hypothetical protein [Kiritimatiellia bacterium]
SSSGSDGKQDGDDEEGGEENSAIVPTGRKHLGMNPGTVVKLNLGPGSVVAGSVRIMFKDLAWGYQVLRVGDDGYPVQVAKRMGETEKASWLLGAVDKVRAGDTVYGDLMVKLVASHDGAEMNFDSVVGVINYQTGEATIDFSKFGESYRFGELKSIGPETYEIKYIEPARSYACVEWASKITTTGYPKTFYLADADLNSVERPSYGHLYEGENWFEAFVDMDGDGQYSAGEPYGFKRGVDIGWSGTEFNIELTDTSPVFGRFRFDGTAWTCDRVVIHGSEADVISDTNTAFAVSGGLQDRLRVVRYALNNGNLSGGSMVAVADKLIDFSVRPYITEADVLPDGKFDIEELGFLGKSTVDVNYSVYALVFGDGDLTTGLADNRVAPYKVVRRFDSVRQKPTIVTDGKPTMFHGAQPTFTWTTGIYNTYSSFRVQVRDAASKVVYDSGNRLAPARDADGNYNWTPDDLFVDDQCKAGNTAMVFSNTNQYTYRVQMCNAKYGESTSDWSADSPQFRMHVNANAEANDTGYSCVKVSVKYFGPDEVVEDALAAGFKGKIRVEAFTSPDFTGTPVARAFYSDDEVALDDDDYSANVVLKGIPSGSYYIRAYIDSDGDFKRSDWESWGYANRRDMTTSGNIFAPVSVTVGPDVALAPLVTVYIEDTDLDGDWLPDAWEWVTSGGSFTAKGPGEFFDKNVFGFADDFQKRFSRVSASGNKLGSNLRALSSSTMNTSDMTALLLGVNTSGYDSSAAALSAWVSPELVEDGISIESLKIENGKVFIKVAGETSAPDSANASSSVYTFAGGDVRTLSVTCNVYVKENLASDEWKLAKSERITVGGEAVEIDAGEAGAASGFYKVEVVK